MLSLAAHRVLAHVLRRRADMLGQRPSMSLFQGCDGLRIDRSRGGGELSPTVDRATNQLVAAHPGFAHSSVTEIGPQNATWFLIFRASGEGWR